MENVANQHPSYDPAEWMPKILEQLRDGATLRQVCRQEGYPSPAWVLKVKEADPVLREQYARAREDGYHAMAEEVIEAADDGRNDWEERERKDGSTFIALNAEAVARSRLRFDARRWLLSKALPKVYGERQQHQLIDSEGQDRDIVLPVSLMLPTDKRRDAGRPA